MSPQELARLHRDAFHRQRPWSAREFEELLAHPTTLLTATKNGFGLLRLLPPEAELLTLAVAPAAQRQGLGRKLLVSVLAGAHAFGARQLLLEVAADNGPALALYESAGFARTGTRPGYYRYPDGSRADAILMRREILP